MKKILISILILLSFGFAFGEKINTKNCKQQKFIVSGYYSPIKGQKYYYRGSYEAEVRLNGQGLRGASGKKVFNGMLAAPKTYNFGTIIHFPGLGVGEVSDRGGAIVKAGVRGHKYDRIDVWMGTGENGLKRALSFGKRELLGYVCQQQLEVGIDYDNINIIDNFFGISLWSMSLENGREDPWVEILQTYLNKLGYIKEKHITGEYDDNTKDAVCKYQITKKIVDENDETCGYFGPSTRASLKNTIISKGIFLAYDEGPRQSNQKITNEEIEEEIDEFIDTYNTLTSEDLYGSNNTGDNIKENLTGSDLLNDIKTQELIYEMKK